MKRTLKVLLAVLMAAGAVGGFSACDNGKTGDGKVTKAELVFEIDEGCLGYEFIAGVAYDDDKIDAMLENIYEAIKPLISDKYDPQVHIYPNYYYKEAGWGGDPSIAMNRWSPQFLRGMDYFKSKGIKVMLEMMSSGLYTNQNGELGTLPQLKLYYAGEHRLKGTSMDIEAMVALKEAYPKTFDSIRFHELIGTNDMGVYPPDDPYWGSHAFAVYDTDLKEIIDACAESGLKLNWSDHTMHRMYDANKNYALDRWTIWEQDWAAGIKYAEQKLGDKLTVTYANNAGNALSTLTLGILDNFRASFPNAKYGLSAQNWFWTALIIQLKIDAPYSLPENDMPLELTAAFSLNAINKGASMIQYEAPYQFFNNHRNISMWHDLGINNPEGFKTYTGVPASYEIAADYSGNLEFARFIDIMMSGKIPYGDVSKMFSGTIVTSNPESNPPVLYTQSTLGLIGDDSYYYDRYINDPSKWVEQSKYRYRDWIFGKDTLGASRIRLAFNGFDDILVRKEEDGVSVAEFYTQRSGCYGKDYEMFADNADGEFAGFVTGNFHSEYVSNLETDSDEVIVARKKDGKLNFTLYGAMNDGKSISTSICNFKYVDKGKVAAQFVMENMLGAGDIPAEGFIKLVNVRTRNSQYSDRTRPLDGLLLVKEGQGGITLKGRRGFTLPRFEKSIAVDGSLIDIATMDTTFDKNNIDELIIAVKKDGNTAIRYYDLASDEVEKVADELNAGNKNFRLLVGLRKFLFQEAND